MVDAAANRFYARKHETNKDRGFARAPHAEAAVTRAFLDVEASLAGRRWRARLDAPGEARAQAIAQISGRGDLLARVLVGRGGSWLISQVRFATAASTRAQRAVSVSCTVQFFASLPVSTSKKPVRS